MTRRPLRYAGHAALPLHEVNNFRNLSLIVLNLECSVTVPISFMIAHIQFRHLGEEINSLLVFNFGAVKDVIMVVPESQDSLKEWTIEEMEEGIIFTRAADGVWTCPRAAVNRFPETFAHLKTAMQPYFNKDIFCFRRRYPVLD
jgi:hypothetical protein